MDIEALHPNHQFQKFQDDDDMPFRFDPDIEEDSTDTGKSEIDFKRFEWSTGNPLAIPDDERAEYMQDYDITELNDYEESSGDEEVGNED